MSVGEGERRGGVSPCLADDVSKLIGPVRTGRVLLIGSAWIDLLIELVHQGFAEVTCQAASAGPSFGEMSADIVIVPACDRVPEFGAALSRLSRVLQPGGILIVSTFSASRTLLRRVRSLLGGFGFSFVREYTDHTGRPVLCCRKLAVSQAQAA